MTNELQFGLDKIVKLWYHVLVNEGKEKSPKQNQKIFSKKFSKPLDKQTNIWYNKTTKKQGGTLKCSM